MTHRFRQGLSRLTQSLPVVTEIVLFILFPALLSCHSRLTRPPVPDKPVVRRLTGEIFAFIGASGDANSGFIVTEEGVVVVDSQINPAMAQTMLSEIKKVTDKPVIYLINTHYHGDHTFANHLFTGVREIIAHEQTKQVLQEREKELLSRFVRFMGEEKSKGIKVTLPTKTFAEEKLSLRAGGRDIQLLFLGKGHTEGDIVVYLPKERVLFAGDLVYVGRLPWVGDGDTREWIKTLGKMKELGPRIVVPGHGDVGDEGSIARFERYLTDLRAEVIRLILTGASLEEVKKKIRLPEYSGDLKYEEWLGFNAEKVYREVTEDK